MLTKQESQCLSMIVAPSCLNRKSFVAMLDQCTRRFLLSLTSIFGAGCTSIGVIDTILLVSIILLCFLSLISFITYFFLQFMALCSRKVLSEVNSA
jgi:hypothetical protein